MVAVPQFLAAIGASVLSSFGVAVYLGTTAGLAIAITVGVATLGLVTSFATRTPKLRDPGDAGGPGSHQILVRSTTEPRKIVYGEAVVSGPLAFMNTNGDGPAGNGTSLYALVALTGHEIDSFQGFFLDDKFVDIADVDTGGDGDVTDAPYAPVGAFPTLYLRGHTGASGQTVDTMVDSGFTLWTSNHRGRGVSYFVARMDQMPEAENADIWERGAPANIAALIRGKKVYDPRLDSTFTGTWGTGSGAHRLATPSTWAYSSNPALCLADYLIDADLGAGFDSSRIDYNSVAIAADDCDDLVDIPTASTEKRFTCNGVLSCGDIHRENIEKILSSMDGTLRIYNGLWRISAGVWPSSSSFALTESDLVGPITYRPQPERTERYNAVRGTYFDPSRAYKESAFLSTEDTTLQSSRDDGMVIWKELDLPMTNSETMCQRLAIRALAQASEAGVCVFPMGYRGMDIAPGDRGTITISELGWNAKTFRCIGLRHVDMVGVELVLKEDSSAAYADPAEGDYGTRTGATVISFPRYKRLIDTVDIEPDAAEVLVSSQPADGTEVLGTISYSGGGTLVDYSVITSASWANDTGESIDVILRQTAKVALSSSDSLIGRKLAIRWSLNGGSSWSYDGTTSDNANITGVSPDFQPRATQRTVTVANGETIDVESIVVLVIPDPTSGDPADVQYRGLSLSIEAIKR